MDASQEDKLNAMRGYKAYDLPSAKLNNSVDNSNTGPWTIPMSQKPPKNTPEKYSTTN